MVAQPACAHVVSREERCEVLACFHVVVKMSIFFGRVSVHCEDLLDYWFH
jgi:hypothetical protein